MTLRRLLCIFIVLALVLLTSYTVFAEAPPSPPCRFYGMAWLDGRPVPDGTAITAIISGDTYTTTTPSLYGNSTYAIKIEPLTGSTYSEGTQVTFMIDGYPADQVGLWEIGGNTRLDLYAFTPPPPTPTPTPEPTPEVTPAPSPTPTPVPTPGLTTPTPTDSGAATSAGNTVIVALCIGILVICLMFIAYLIWKYRIRPKETGVVKKGGPKPAGGPPPPDTEAAVEKPEGEPAEEGEAAGEIALQEAAEGAEEDIEIDLDKAIGEISMRWQDRLMLKMMSNQLIIRIFSIPIVVKIVTWEMKVFIAIMSLFKREKDEGDGAEEQ